MRLAVVGSGRLGRVLGQRLARVGHEVVYARGNSALQATAAQPGTRAAAVNVDAVGDAELVVLTVPFAAVGTALGECGPLHGKLVWSCVNAVTHDGSRLAVGFDDSAAETVARCVPTARVVAALPPSPDVISCGLDVFDGARPTTWMCGGSRQDKAVIAGLLHAIGAEPLDAGPLEAARLIEPAMLLLHHQAHAVTPPRRLGLRLIEQGWEHLDALA